MRDRSVTYQINELTERHVKGNDDWLRAVWYRQNLLFLLVVHHESMDESHFGILLFFLS